LYTGRDVRFHEIFYGEDFTENFDENFVKFIYRPRYRTPNNKYVNQLKLTIYYSAN